MKKILLFILGFTIVACAPNLIQAKPNPTALFIITPIVVLTPTSTPTTIPSPTITPSATMSTEYSPNIDLYYIVQEGDTLLGIAEMLSDSIDKITKLNDLSNRGPLYPSEVLIVTPWYPEIPAPTTCDKQIIAVLHSQRAYAFHRCQLIREFVMSSGAWPSPTVTGEYHIWIKLESAHMQGDGYDLPNVPWTMYFYKSYALHGKNWDSIYGRPMSHGCVGLQMADAVWLYDWTPVGTDVLILH